jgi:DnaJ-class molecular chaperone
MYNIIKNGSKIKFIKMSKILKIFKKKCKYCEGTGFEGYDRSYPPNPYICEHCGGSGILNKKNNERNNKNK